MKGTRGPNWEGAFSQCRNVPIEALARIPSLSSEEETMVDKMFKDLAGKIPAKSGDPVALLKSTTMEEVMSKPMWPSHEDMPVPLKDYVTEEERAKEIARERVKADLAQYQAGWAAALAQTPPCAFHDYEYSACRTYSGRVPCEPGNIITMKTNPNGSVPSGATHWNSMHKQWRRIDGNQMYGWVEEWRHFGQVREIEEHLVPIENLREAFTTGHVSKGWTHFEDD